MQEIMAFSPGRAGFGITAIEGETGDLQMNPAVMARVLRRHWRWLRQALTQVWGMREPDGSASPLVAIIMFRDRAWFDEVQVTGRLRSLFSGLEQAVLRHGIGGRSRSLEDMAIELFGLHWKAVAMRDEEVAGCRTIICLR